MENNNGVKKKKKRGIGLIILAIVAIVIVGLVATGIAGAREAMKALKEMNIKSYTVADGTVEKTVSGSGQIEAADTEDVTAPVGVKVDKVLVSTGDTVTKGQKLAEIDADSITDCLVEIESSLKSISDQLDEDAKKKADDEDKLTDLQKEQLNNESDELKKAQTELNALKSNPYITASTDGIIGDVNITEGSSISQMAGSSSSSQSLSSLGEDASSYLSGAMGSASSTTVSGPATGTTADVVTIVPASGSTAEIAHGTKTDTAAPTSAPAATADISVNIAAPGAKTDTATLVAASDTKNSGTTYLIVDPDNSSTTNSNGSAGAGSASGGSGTADSGSTANNNATGNGSAADSNSTSGSNNAANSSSTSGSSNAADSSSTSGSNGAADSTTDHGDSTAQQKVTSWDVLTSRMTAPAAGAAPVTAAQLFADVDGKTFAEVCHYTGTIGWIEIPADSSQGSNQGTSSQGNQTQDAQTQGTQPGFATFSDGRLYTAVITLSAADGYVFSSDSEPSPSAFDGALTSLVRTEISGDGRAMTILVPYVLTPENTLADTLEKLTQQEQQAVTALQQLISQGLSGLSGLSGLNALSDLSKLSGLNGANAGGLLNGLSGLNGASAYGLSAADELSGAAGSANVSYSPYESIAFTVRKTDRMKVQVSIDEQDILLLSKGQKADVTLDALEGQTFEGTVTEIGADAETGSGSAKYPVTIEIDSADDMKFGMSAEVTVKVGEAADVLVIPMDALQQEGETTFVYTEEADDGTLGGKKNVETGLSDGENVEITSGLSDGDTIYYQKADSSNTFSSPFMDESTSSSSSSSS